MTDEQPEAELVVPPSQQRKLNPHSLADQLLYLSRLDEEELGSVPSSLLKRAAYRLGKGMQPIENAPKDGSDVTIPLALDVKAFWCKDLQTWVLNTPLILETLSNPTHYRDDT